MSITGNYFDMQTLIDAISKARKESKNQKWIFVQANVGTRCVEVKTFGHTYLQIYRIDGKQQELPPMDCNVGKFNAALLQPWLAA